MISEKILKEFGIEGVGIDLLGGQSTSKRYGDIVIKPINDVAYSNFISQVFGDLQAMGYRISRPIQSRNGQYVVEGYVANTYEPGEQDLSRVEDLLDISEKLHNDLKKMPMDGMPEFDNPWAKAQQVLWKGQEIPSNWHKSSRELVIKLLDELEVLELSSQLIHSDLSGNVLFHETLEPLVIDFSPTFAPCEYANALAVCDNIAWGDSPMSSLELLRPVDLYKKVIKYAVAFRVMTVGFIDPLDYDRMHSEWKNFEQIWKYCEEEG